MFSVGRNACLDLDLCACIYTWKSSRCLKHRSFDSVCEWQIFACWIKRVLVHHLWHLVFNFLGLIAAIAIATHGVAWSVGYVREPCKNGWTNRDAVWGAESGGPKEPCIRWRCRSPRGGGNLWGLWSDESIHRREGWQDGDAAFRQNSLTTCWHWLYAAQMLSPLVLCCCWCDRSLPIPVHKLLLIALVWVSDGSRSDLLQATEREGGMYFRGLEIVCGITSSQTWKWPHGVRFMDRDSRWKNLKLICESGGIGLYHRRYTSV